MNLYFYGPGFNKDWQLKDDVIIVGKKTIQLSSITDFKHIPKDRIIDIWVGNSLKVLMYDKSQILDGLNAFNYIEEHAGTEEQQSIRKWEKELKTKEFRTKCNVCGNLFCFKYSDLERNQKNAKTAIAFSTLTIANAFIGTPFAAYSTNREANRYLDRIADYSHCPKCNSTDLSFLSDKEWETIKNQQTIPQQVPNQQSPIEEIKQFKELLDAGIITQEEFNIKKKQLLGL